MNKLHLYHLDSYQNCSLLPMHCWLVHSIKILKMCLIAGLWLSIYIILHVTVSNNTDLSQPHRRGIRRGLVPLYLTGSSSRRQLGPHTWSTDIEHTLWQLLLVVVQSILHGFYWSSLPSNLLPQQSWNTALIYQSYRYPQIYVLINLWKTDNYGKLTHTN